MLITTPALATGYPNEKRIYSDAEETAIFIGCVTTSTTDPGNGIMKNKKKKANQRRFATFRPKKIKTIPSRTKIKDPTSKTRNDWERPIMNSTNPNISRGQPMVGVGVMGRFSW